MCYPEMICDNILQVTVETQDNPKTNESYWDHASIVAEKFPAVKNIVANPMFLNLQYVIGTVNVEIEWVEDWAKESENTVCCPVAPCPRCGHEFTPCQGAEQSANEPVDTKACPSCRLRRLYYDTENEVWEEL